MKKVLQFIQDLATVIAMERRGWDYKFTAIFHLLYWHLILKHFSKGFIGTYHGLRFLYDTRSDGCALTYILENLEFPVLWWVTHTVQSGDVFIDIGSNIGNFSLLAAQKGAQVLAFEPNEEVLDLQRIQLLLNGFSNVKTFSEVIGDKKGYCSFFLDEIGKSGVSGLFSKSSTAHKIRMRMTTVDDVVKEQNIKKIQTIKIDAEGAELLIFGGMQNVLKAKRIEYVIWEISSLRERQDLRTALQTLMELGYSTKILGDTESATTAISYLKSNRSAKRMMREYDEDYKKGVLN